MPAPNEVLALSLEWRLADAGPCTGHPVAGSREQWCGVHRENLGIEIPDMSGQEPAYGKESWPPVKRAKPA